MTINRNQLMGELEMKLSEDKDGEIYDTTAGVARDVQAEWRRIAHRDLNRGYATGEYAASIMVETDSGQHPAGTLDASGTKVGGRFWAHSRVVTYSPIAHFLEYGTGPDDAPNYPAPPKNHGHWEDHDGNVHFWWNTPTPVFALAAKTEMAMDVSAMSKTLGKLPSAPRSRGAQRRVKHGTDIIRTINPGTKNQNLRGGKMRDRSKKPKSD